MDSSDEDKPLVVKRAAVKQERGGEARAAAADVKPKVKIEKKSVSVKEEEDGKTVKKGAAAKKGAVKDEKPGKKGPAGAVTVKRERKEYDLPGQKRDPPEERDPIRIFYETLYNQRPESEMAQIWMMENGLLDEEKAQEVLDMKNKKAGKVVNKKSGGQKATNNGSKKGPPTKEKKRGKDEDEPLGPPTKKKR